MASNLNAQKEKNTGDKLIPSLIPSIYHLLILQLHNQLHFRLQKWVALRQDSWAFPPLSQQYPVSVSQTQDLVVPTPQQGSSATVLNNVCGQTYQHNV
jgi:hypothetical protein